jgi:Flp pilus assembly protein TadB
MDEHIRASDADRDRVTTRLQEHFAAGRLTRDELDERIAAVLHAKTFGELRPVLADLPEPVPAPAAAPAQRAGRPWPARRHRPVAPLVLLLLLAAVLVSSGGWLALALLKVVLVFWLLLMLAGVLVAGRIRRRMRRGMNAGYGPPWHHQRWDHQHWHQQHRHHQRWL